MEDSASRRSDVSSCFLSYFESKIPICQAAHADKRKTADGGQGGGNTNMREKSNILLLTIVVSVALSVAGCFSRTTREVNTVPTPPPVVQVTPPSVVQVTPPAATSVPDMQSTTITSAPGTRTSTTTWDNGSVVQKNTVTESLPGAVRKQTTTTWNSTDLPPSQTTVTTTTNPY